MATAFTSVLTPILKLKFRTLIVEHVEHVEQQSLLGVRHRSPLCSDSRTRKMAFIRIIFVSKPDFSGLAPSRSRIVFHPLSDSFSTPGSKWTWIHNMAAFVCYCEWRRFWVHEH